ncbi:unnamed protein product [Protopolystoma xenopodis]|uniref:Uncharacterized protein n=1 Tax=Protopolystoma xenopodis TaxID=117903 RepID=A0A3S5BDZ9_9PLAT|nr:unnamed protein product [Protopolystoma xenopodis]
MGGCGGPGFSNYAYDVGPGWQGCGYLGGVPCGGVFGGCGWGWPGAESACGGFGGLAAWGGGYGGCGWGGWGCC